ncbi:hypothetical protein HHI36_001483 [Cryptolaemus montrouzieri]|uniref:Uracil-DNA glycosylase-like domain-containing protein n=1 Tax=Cryptolaemus montrouzieri TaxID=559131 RepID=A0ABD2P8B5_9CUCU
MLRKKLKIINCEEEIGGTSSETVSEKPHKNVPAQECLDLISSKSEQTDHSKYFPKAYIVPEPIPQKMMILQRDLNNMLREIIFSEPPVSYVYNPTIYAVEPFEKYLNLYCYSTKKVIFLGMNPGPWGMCQTGVPFGEVTSVRDWLQIEGHVTQPENVCSKRTVEGFDCKKKEVSGDRFWNFFKKLCGSPHIFFKNSFVYNYCPIALMKKEGANITPAELEVSIKTPLEEACDKTLLEVAKLLKPEFIIGIGRYAEKRAKIALKSLSPEIKIIYLTHPSPRSATSNNWAEKANQFIIEHNLTQYFQE